MNRGVALLLDRAGVAQGVHWRIAVRRLLFEQLLGFLEALGLATAMLGRGSLRLVHTLHAAATADSCRFGCRRFLLLTNLWSVVFFSHATQFPAAAEG